MKNIKQCLEALDSPLYGYAVELRGVAFIAPLDVGAWIMGQIWDLPEDPFLWENYERLEVWAWEDEERKWPVREVRPGYGFWKGEEIFRYPQLELTDGTEIRVEGYTTSVQRWEISGDPADLSQLLELIEKTGGTPEELTFSEVNRMSKVCSIIPRE